MEAPFKRGDIVMHKSYGLAVVMQMWKEGSNLVEVNWLLPAKTTQKLIYRENHKDFDMRTSASNFTKIGEVPDADI